MLPNGKAPLAIMRPQFLQVNTERVKSADGRDYVGVGQRRGRKVIRDGELESRVFRNFLDCGVGIELAKPQASFLVEIEYTEIRDEPLWPVAPMAEIGPRAAVGGSMAKAGDEIASLNQPIAASFARRRLATMGRRPKRHALRVAGKVCSPRPHPVA